MSLKPYLPEDVWVDQCVMELAKRMPSLTPEQVTEIVKGELWEEARDWNPVDLAEVYALDAPPNDPGAPEKSLAELRDEATHRRAQHGR